MAELINLNLYTVENPGSDCTGKYLSQLPNLMIQINLRHHTEGYAVA